MRFLVPLGLVLTLVAPSLPAPAAPEASSLSPLMRALAEARPSSVADAVRVADARWGVTAPAPVAQLGPAVARLAAEHGARLDAQDAATVAHVEAHAPEVALALGGIVSAYADVSAAVARVDGVDAARARSSLLHAAAAFQIAVAADGRPLPTLEVAGVLVADLSGVDSRHEDDVLLLVDVGGDDVYLNNAGGSGVGTDAYRLCGSDHAAASAAAFLLDLAGSDRYGDPTIVRCGVNGGGAKGMGILLDVAGNDVYGASASDASNGGSWSGSGALLDLAGHDVFLGGSNGANGGARGVGDAFLLDLAGHDSYHAQDRGVNGGAMDGGVAALLDARGNDTYAAGGTGANGGSSDGTSALLVDGGGDDDYSARAFGTNGGSIGAAFDACVGSLCPIQTQSALAALLLDAGGRDAYRDATIACEDCSRVPKETRGLLLDLSTLPAG